MTARSNIQSNATTKVYISATRPTAFTEAEYTSTDIVYSLIGEVENVGNHGVTAQIIEFTAVNDAVVQKLKGSKNYGTMNLMIGHVPGDAGQTIVRAASESQNRYSVKVLYPVGDGEATPETHYLDVLVASAENQDGGANDVRKLACAFAVCRAPVIVSAT